MTLQRSFLVFFFLVGLQWGYSQVPITQNLSFNGRFDFLMFGNTNNKKGNSTALDFNCTVDNVSASSADFTLPASASGVKKAFLYWSGTGNGDLDVKLSGPNGLNNLPLTSQKTYSHIVSANAGPQPYFSASYDVTQILQDYGQGNYTLSDLDVDRGPAYCSQTLYSGWVIVVVYEDATLPLNTVKLYDGFVGISATTINFSLGGIKITQPNGAKLGFVVWEGDDLPNLGSEGMSVNGHPLMNNINPNGELYNGTNSYTGSTANYNMDMDFFDISPYVSAGDTQLDIKATAGNDIVFFNIYAITFNNELPDATVVINNHTGICESKDITINYTVYNSPANDTLPANVDVSFYANSPSGILLGTQKTSVPLLIGDSIVQSITLTIPSGLGDEFDIIAVVDDGNSIKELEEGNNLFKYKLKMPVSYNLVDNQGICEGDTLFWGNQTFTQSLSEDFRFTSEFGCDSLVHLNLTVQPTQYTDIDVHLCQGTSYFLPDSTEVSEAGDYTVTISSQYGCDSIVITHISIVNEISSTAISAVDNYVELGDSTRLSLSTNFTPDSIRWTPAESISCDTCPHAFVSPLNKTTYKVNVYDEFGCLLKDSIDIRVIKKDEIFVPNAFSPNGDGINDFLEVYTDKDVKSILSFQVFDRWGSLVFDRNGIPANERQNVWDGFYKGKPLTPGVYVYQVLIQFLDNRTKVFAGDVTLIK